jgi:hypothetical protein
VSDSTNKETSPAMRTASAAGEPSASGLWSCKLVEIAADMV